MKLYDRELRSAENYGVAIFWAVSIGRLFATFRLLFAAVVTGCFVAGDLGRGRWLWIGAPAVALIGSSLAWLHPREDVLQAMRDSSFGPARLVGRYLLAVARRASISLPGLLEGIGPFLMGLALGAPTSPLADHPDLWNIAIAATVTYAATAAFQWLADGSYYLPGRGGVPASLARILRWSVPSLLAVIYALILSWGVTNATSTVPWLAAGVLLLLYPALLLFDDMLRAAETHRADHVDGEMMRAACTVHAFLSTPVHFIEMEARYGTAERVVGQLRDLRTRVRQCRIELVEGAPAGRIGDLLTDVTSFVPPDRRHLLTLTDDSDVVHLGRVDFAMARRVITDLCGNALKSAADGRVGAAAQVQVRWRADRAGDRAVAVAVVDDGSGIRGDVLPGSSLELLRTTLELAGGGLQLQSIHGGGTRATGWWRAQPEEVDQ